MVLFGDVEVPPLEVCEREIDNYNVQARAVWKSPLSFFERQKSCEDLLDRVFPLLRTVQRRVDNNLLRRFPAQIEGQLNAIFHHHYDSKEKRLLFGRTDEEAYKVQYCYASSVVGLLERIDAQYAAKACLCLQGIYGRGAPLPLLCESSIMAMWEVCQDQYYKRQIALVS